MITEENIKLNISYNDAIKMKAFKYGTYDNLKQELSFTVNHASKENFRLVHDNTKAYCIIEGEEKTVTSTLYKVKDFKTEQGALNKIIELGLEYNPPENDELDTTDDELDVIDSSNNDK